MRVWLLVSVWAQGDDTEMELARPFDFPLTPSISVRVRIGSTEPLIVARVTVLTGGVIHVDMCSSYFFRYVRSDEPRDKTLAAYRKQGWALRSEVEAKLDSPPPEALELPPAGEEPFANSDPN